MTIGTVDDAGGRQPTLEGSVGQGGGDVADIESVRGLLDQVRGLAVLTFTERPLALSSAAAAVAA
ncbi:hypothetical protein [Streptomyces sp. 2R]|uniref:hypothetical protein n=1 Tax=Streptomyces sp. 2R TaxID=1883452 RepID=UPI000B9F6A14|nr:hypothetical protein [Streptomyces sp. 2R]OXZ01764.1 hypothetical protein BEH93_29575 [Streptomyces sp. 2R]